MQNYFGILLLLSSLVTFSEAFIVPQEIPSLLSLVYSNIPPIRKGTDSRIGFGYRLGDHADFQVQFEIGPQKETKAIGASSASKRNVRPDDEFQIEKAIKREKVKKVASSSSSWLENWFNQMRYNDNPKMDEKPSDSIKSPMISQSALFQLQKLYSHAEDAETTTIPSINEPQSTEVGVLPALSQSDRLPNAALAILQANRAYQTDAQNIKARVKSRNEIDAITAELSDVDIE